jgi:hypothetical protein
MTFVRGKPTNGVPQLNKYLSTLNGNYTFDIQEENTLTTIKECRAAYFTKVDIVQKHSGDERYDIHEAFKAHQGIGSTKEFTVTDWRNLIKNFQIYVFENYDIVI